MVVEKKEINPNPTKNNIIQNKTTKIEIFLCVNPAVKSK
jgi:hypothetical protein